MAEKSTFFNSVSGDRKYKAEDMAAHFAKLITNGVYPAGTQLQATEDAGMSVTVSAGSAWINGYAYHNDDDFTLTFDAADGVLNRIDRIVVRWGRLARSINLAIIKGTPGSSPTAPAVVRNADYYDLGIATVSIGAGITAITQAMITDTRLDSNVCGFVSSLIQPDTSGWFTQFDSAFTAALASNQSAWEAWFADVQNILDENVAGNLLNLINNVADELDEHKEEEATDAHQISNITGLQNALNGKIGAGTANTDVQEILTFLLPTDTRSWIPTTFDATTPTKPTHIDIKDGATVVATLDMTYDEDGNITELIASDGTTTVTYTISWTDGVWQGTTKAVV